MHLVLLMKIYMFYAVSLLIKISDTANNGFMEYKSDDSLFDKDHHPASIDNSENDSECDIFDDSTLALSSNDAYVLLTVSSRYSLDIDLNVGNDVKKYVNSFNVCGNTSIMNFVQNSIVISIDAFNLFLPGNL